MFIACIMFKTPRLKSFKHGVLNIMQAGKTIASQLFILF